MPSISREIKKIISELEEFKAKVEFYFKHRFDQYSGVSREQVRKVRDSITKQSPRIKEFLKNAGVNTRLVGRAAPVAGSFPFQMDLIEDMFQNEGGPYGVQPDFIYDALTRAIGIYESGKLPAKPTKKTGDAFIDNGRLKELKGLQPSNFDLSKLIKILEELNSSFENENYLAVILLVRALIDHVPPIFKQQNFGQVSANYGGSKSFKESMSHLENSSRKIADHYLHCQIRQKETIPNKTQVNFSHDVDVLLGEIVRILK